MKRRALLFPALVLALLWACHLSPEDSRDTIAIDSDSTWTSYSRIRIDMLDSSGSVLATLFDDTVRSPDQLRNLSAEKYAGGDIRILIVGYVGDTLVFEQSRLWEARSGKVNVDTVKDPWVLPRGVVLSPAELTLWLGGPDTAVEARIEPAYAEQNLVFTSEDEGAFSFAPDTTRPGRAVRLKPIQTGETRLKAASAKEPSRYAVLTVKVKQDVPRLAISASASETAIDHPVVYACTTRQEYGSIISFAWDLDGDGAWDDSLAGDWPGAEVVLPTRSSRYAREGRVTPRFRVRDTEGNVAEAALSVDVRNAAPEIRGIRKGTVISIRDSVAMFAIAEDRDGGVRWVGWDFEGNGTFDDTAAAVDSVVEIRTGYRYPEAGEYEAVLEVRDVHGKPTRVGFKVTVERDPPIADAGRDTAVVVGAAMRIRAGGSDKHGTIVKREVRVGAAFVTLSKTDTTLTAPSEPAVIEYVIRVTDDDGLSDEDTVVVTVVRSSVADLADIQLSSGSLEPDFNSSTLNYSARVPFRDSLVRVTFVSVASESRVAVNGRILASGTLSDPVRLPVGANPSVFRLVVTAADGRTQKVYDLSVTREPDTESRLKQLVTGGFVLRPAFAPSILEYSDTVSSRISSVTLKPVVLGIGAVVSSGGKILPPGDSLVVALEAGENIIPLDVTAQDEMTQSRYRIRVFRKAAVLVTRVAGNPPVEGWTDSLDILPGRSFRLASPLWEGYHFQAWRVTNGLAEIADTLANPTMCVARSVSVVAQARWAINTYSITSGPALGGVVVPASMTVEHGRDSSVQLNPSPGYRVLSLSDNGQDVSQQLTGEALGVRSYRLRAVTASRRLEAGFQRIFRATGTVPGGGGGISLSASSVDSGKGLVVTLTPQVGYYLSGLSLNGQNVLPLVVGNRNGATTFSAGQVDEDLLLIAAYTRRTFQLTVNDGGSWIGGVIPACIADTCGATVTRTVNYGEPVVISTQSCYPTSCGGSGCSYKSFIAWSGSGGSLANLNALKTTVTLTETDATYRPQFSLPGVCRQ